MYLSRIRPASHTDQLRRLAHIAGGGQYRMHQAVWKLFERDPDAKRDFLYRQEGQADKLSFLVLSLRRPGNDDGLWEVQTKEYAPRLRTGQRLHFSIRVNPVIKRRDEKGRQLRHDLVMDLKKNGADPDQTQAELVQQAARQWLGARTVHNGFELTESSLIGEAYRQWRFVGKNGRKISFSSIDCSGVLTIADTDRFEKALTRGIGPEKAFGCGLLLIRPA
jgi:CRISPR system Cascade subunit CasE